MQFFRWLVTPMRWPYWTILLAFALGMVFNGAVGAEQDRNVLPQTETVDPKDHAPGPVPNPPVAAVQQYPPGCSSHAILAEGLKEKYHEIPLIIGVSKKNYLFELFGSSFEDGTFTIVLTNVEGVACLVDSGNQLNFLLNMVPTRRAESQLYKY